MSCLLAFKGEMLWQGQDDNVRIYVIKDRVDKSGPKWATSDEAQAQITPVQETLKSVVLPKVGGSATPEKHDSKFQVVPENLVKTQDDAKKMVQALFEESKARQVQKLQNKESSSPSINPSVPSIVSQIVVPVVPVVPSPPKKIAVEKIEVQKINNKETSQMVSGGFKTTPISPTSVKPTPAILKNTSSKSSIPPLSSNKPSSHEIQRRKTLTQIRSEQQQQQQQQKNNQITKNHAKIMQNSEDLMPSPELKGRAKNTPPKKVVKKPKNINKNNTSVPVIKSIENATSEATKSISNIKINKSRLKQTKTKTSSALTSTSSSTPKNNDKNNNKFKLRNTSDNRINNRYEKALQNAKMRQNMRLWAVNKEQKFFE